MIIIDRGTRVVRANSVRNRVGHCLRSVESVGSKHVVRRTNVELPGHVSGVTVTNFDRLHDITRRKGAWTTVRANLPNPPNVGTVGEVCSSESSRNPITLTVHLRTA